MEDHGSVALRRLLAALPAVVQETHARLGDATAIVDRARILDVLRLLRDDRELDFAMLSDVTAVDYCQLLTLDPADPTAYLVDGQSERMTKRTVTVGVKDGSPVTRTQWWTRYGPVVTSLGADLPLPWTAGTAYAVHDPNAANMRFTDTSSVGLTMARR